MALYLRASRGDNRVIDELLAPAASGISFGRRVPIRGLVVDAPTIDAKPAFGEAAEAAGLPLLIDPLTMLFQDEQAAGHPWANLPYAQAEPADPTDFLDGKVLDELIERVITFQIERGASVLIPPYFNARSLNDPWWQVQLLSNRRTAAFLRSEGIHLPAAPVLAGSLRQFGNQRSWPLGVDEFMRSVSGMLVRFVPLALSFTKPGKGKGDTVDGLGAYLGAVQRISASEPVLAWRQGQYGLAAVAAGATGYQTGFGVDERCDMPSFTRSRRPRGGPQGPFGQHKYVYFQGFDRSLQGKPATALLENRLVRGGLTCPDAVCCPDGASSMTTNWRQHVARSRARQLEELLAMPDTTWRLNEVARRAERAAVVSKDANEVLADAGMPTRLPEASYRSLAEVADAMRMAAMRPAAG